GAYSQADHGGELSRSFAVVWNVPIRYRDDYARYPIREEVEWQPRLFTHADLDHFDYVLTRSPFDPGFPADWGLTRVRSHGQWARSPHPRARPPCPAWDCRCC